MNEDKFSIEETVANNNRVVLLKGVIDEDTNLSPIEKIADPIQLNLSQVTSINSLGIRSWVNFWKTMANREVYYLECPPLIVRQLNMIPSFSGNAKIISVFVPYICDECEAEELKLIQCGHPNWKLADVPETVPCDQCVDGKMEADGSLKQYFSFKR